MRGGVDFLTNIEARSERCRDSRHSQRTGRIDKYTDGRGVSRVVARGW
jgi:hypothetical protein